MRRTTAKRRPLAPRQWLAVGLFVSFSGLAQAQAEGSVWIDASKDSKRIYPVETLKPAGAGLPASANNMKLIWPTARQAPALAVGQLVAPVQGLPKPVEGSPSVSQARPAKPSARTAASRATPLMLKTVMQASQRFKVDAYLIKAVIHAESAFNPCARSPKHAIGLMQVLAGTARDMGLSAQPEATVEQLLTDPRVSIVVGTKYLAEQLDRFGGNVELALAAYNAGPGAVIKSGTKVPPYRETKAYVKRVMELAQGYRQRQTLRGVAL
jgi:soluble lytic murein transglycosylase-like protein